MTYLKANKPYPSEEQIAQVMKDRKLKRISAVQYLRRQSAKSQVIRDTFVAPPMKPATILDKANAKLVKAAKATKKTKGEHKAKYDAAKVIAMWDKGMTLTTIRESDAPGVKGISSPYVSRILFGTTFENAQSPEQVKRQKEEARRREERKAGK